jgi:uncharacterized protein YceK
MKKILVMLAILASGCSPDKEVVSVINGDDGKDGANGHSIVSSFNEASQCECSNGGTRLDLFVDLDDSLTASESDLYQGSFVACNGANGLNGEQGVAGEQGPAGEIGPQGPAGSTGAQGPVGPQGPTGPQGLTGATGASGSGATILASSSTCTQVDGNYYMKNDTLYYEDDSNKCDGNHDKVSLNSSGDSMWVAAKKLAVKDGNGVLRVIIFN